MAAFWTAGGSHAQTQVRQTHEGDPASSRGEVQVLQAGNELSGPQEEGQMTGPQAARKIIVRKTAIAKAPPIMNHLDWTR